MRFAGQRVFVSGGAGVIGDTLVRALHREGALVLVGDLKPRPADWPGDILYRQGDLNTLQAWEMEAFGPTLFFHLAATFERSVESFEFWDENFRHNVRLSHHLIGLLRESPTLRRAVFASSYLVYDPQTYIFNRPADAPVTLSEDHRLRPRNLCGGAKLIHELELDFLAHFAQTRFSAASARIFRSYGRGSRDVISRWVRACLSGEPIEVYNPEGMFDYVYADDVAEGLIRLGLSGSAATVNLGRGRARRVAEVVAALRQHFPAMEVRTGQGEARFEASQADMAGFARLLGWAPATELEDAIPRIIAHETAQAGAARPAPFNVLITSVSQKLSCVREARRALLKLHGEGQVHGGDIDPDCPARGFVDAFWTMPRLEALSLDALIGYCRDRRIGAIVPTRDGELAWFAERRAALAQAGVAVMVPGPDAVDLCLDKLRFARELRALGYPAIPAFEDPASCASDRLAVKERFGAGSLGVRLGVSAAEALAAARQCRRPIFQPFIAGTEYSVDTFTAADGATKGAVARRRDRVVRGESQVTTAVDAPALEALCAEAATAIGLRGHAVWQAIEDAAGDLHIIECNCRIGGASSLSIAMGLDSFFWAFCEAAGDDLSRHPFRRSPVNLRQTRIPHDVICTDSAQACAADALPALDSD